MTTTKRPESVEIYLPSVLGYEKVARSAAEAIALEMEFSPERIEDLKTAVAEACMNAIEHGNNLEQTATVTVLLTAAPSKLEVRVADSGLQMFLRRCPNRASVKSAGGACFSSSN
jgi:serine/threonine-protein kinase RsbW